MKTETPSGSAMMGGAAALVAKAPNEQQGRGTSPAVEKFAALLKELHKHTGSGVQHASRETKDTMPRRNSASDGNIAETPEAEEGERSPDGGPEEPTATPAASTWRWDVRTLPVPHAGLRADGPSVARSDLGETVAKTAEPVGEDAIGRRDSKEDTALGENLMALVSHGLPDAPLQAKQADSQRGTRELPLVDKGALQAQPKDEVNLSRTASVALLVDEPGSNGTLAKEGVVQAIVTKATHLAPAVHGSARRAGIPLDIPSAGPASAPSTIPGREARLAEPDFPRDDGNGARSDHGERSGERQARNPRADKTALPSVESPQKLLNAGAVPPPETSGLTPARQIADTIARVVDTQMQASEQPQSPTDSGMRGPVKLLSIALLPERLGQIHLHLRIGAEGVHLNIAAERAETSELLKHDRDTLRKLIEDSGLKVEDVAIRVAGAERTATAQPSDSNAGQRATSFAQQGAQQFHEGAHADGRRQPNRSGGNGGTSQKEQRDDEVARDPRRPRSDLYV